MTIKELMSKIRGFFNENVAPPFKITSIEEREGDESGWTATVEVIEEKEYMKRYAKDEMLGTYSVVLDKDGEVTSFKREGIRYRSKVDGS
ncbi:gas vesicle protein GvpO [Staphylococcus simulans]|uniref:gas vesicle protein GvpO n=1 Tax=Staphylococcus simulans TaxID=1286 RepID=UPI000D1EF9A6|nr:gas vesicle protein GvpO [Staphylococcus simulans]PTJ90205.1 gas vesicle protein GvpR [Staphylococcus simulans]